MKSGTLSDILTGFTIFEIHIERNTIIDLSSIIQKEDQK